MKVPRPPGLGRGLRLEAEPEVEGAKTPGPGRERKSPLSHLPLCGKALSPHFRPPLPILVARDLRGGGLTSRGSFLPLLGLRSGPTAGRPTLRMCYLSARSPSPSQAASTPPPASPRPSGLLPPHLPARSRGPQVRKTAKFHAPRTPASSCDKKGRRGRAELPGRCVRLPKFMQEAWR